MPDLDMTSYNLEQLNQLNKVEQVLHLAHINQQLEEMSAEQRIAWALQHLPQQAVVSSSFGAQSALMLHLMIQQQPTIPVLLTDTGYLFKETYQFIDELSTLFNLQLSIYSAKHSPQWQEARYGQLWLQGVEGISRYNQMNKVEPLQRGLKELHCGVWFSGLRREQSKSRSQLSILSIQHGVFKFLPVIDWSDDQVDAYFQLHQLPYHPLRAQGYLSIGDTHTTVKWQEGMKEEDTRFFGLKRECGLHEDTVNDGSGI